MIIVIIIVRSLLLFWPYLLICLLAQTFPFASMSGFLVVRYFTLYYWMPFRDSKKWDSNAITFAPCVKGIQDSRGFWIPGTEFFSLSVKLGFRILIVRGIPDPTSCNPDYNAEDSEFHKKQFPGFRNLDSLNMGRTRYYERSKAKIK